MSDTELLPALLGAHAEAIPPHDMFVSINGLEPRYLRERRRSRDADDLEAAEEPSAPPVPINLWSPDDLCSMDGLTPDLRRRIMEAEREPKPFPPAVVLPIALGVSMFLWFALSNAAVVVIGRVLDLM
jgi:hypothetical protein